MMRSAMLDALRGSNREVTAAAVEVVVRNYVTDLSMPELTEQFLAATKGSTRRLLLDTLDPSRFALRLTSVSSYNPGRITLPQNANLFSSDLVRNFVADSLEDRDPAVRAAAQDLVNSQPDLRTAAPVEAAMRRVVKPAPRVPDFNYFVRFVQPVLAKQGADGKACVVCHSSHVIFPLRLPNGKAEFTHEQSRQNYSFALKVANTVEPRKSLLLLKPTRPNDATGDAGLYLSTHNGGERWPGNETSREYELILNWIRGLKADGLEDAAGGAASGGRTSGSGQ
jgi:hypothetical protein